MSKDLIEVGVDIWGIVVVVVVLDEMILEVVIGRYEWGVGVGMMEMNIERTVIIGDGVDAMVVLMVLIVTEADVVLDVTVIEGLEVRDTALFR